LQYTMRRRSGKPGGGVVDGRRERYRGTRRPGGRPMSARTVPMTDALYRYYSGRHPAVHHRPARAQREDRGRRSRGALHGPDRRRPHDRANGRLTGPVALDPAAGCAILDR
jgi:hypothetical protein